MTTLATDAAVATTQRQHLKRERQARVGILRNTNQPPRPPIRRAALTGKWPALRSSRRASPGLIERLLASLDPPPPPRSDLPADPPAIVVIDAGRINAIDVGALDATLPSAPLPAARVPFAAEFRAAVERRAAEEGDDRPAILRPDAWRDPSAPVPAPTPVPDEPQTHSPHATAPKATDPTAPNPAARTINAPGDDAVVPADNERGWLPRREHRAAASSRAGLGPRLSFVIVTFALALVSLQVVLLATLG